LGDSGLAVDNFFKKICGLWVTVAQTVDNFSKNMGSLGESDAEKGGAPGIALSYPEK